MRVTNLQTFILSIFLALLGGGISAMDFNIPGIILVTIGLLGIVSVFTFNIYRSRAEVFPSNLIPWLFLKIQKNDPNLFPELRELTLKSHIAVASKLCPHEKDIKHIYLFRGVEIFKYQLVVIGTDNDRFYDLCKYWERKSLSNVFKPDFYEVYKEKPIDKSFWVDWGIGVVLSVDEFPDELIDKKRKWTLY